MPQSTAVLPQRPFLYILCLSRGGADGQQRRDAVRRSWSRAADAWPAMSTMGDARAPLVRTLFVRGGFAPQEAGIVGDELRLTAAEGYRYVSLKVLAALRFLFQRDPSQPSAMLRPPFVAKVDDDAWVCVPSLLDAIASLATHEHAKPHVPPYYLGTFTFGRPVATRHGARWEDAPHWRVFHLSHYPDYAQGALYALSSAAVDAALAAASSYGLFNRSAHPSDLLTPVNEDALLGTLLHVSLGQQLRYRRLPVRVYPKLTAKQGASARSLRTETEKACSDATGEHYVAVHKLPPADVIRCGQYSDAGPRAAKLPRRGPPRRCGD